MQPKAPIFGFNDARDDIVRTVIERVVTGTKDPLLALNAAAYHETKRLLGSRRLSDQKELAEWQRLDRSLRRMSDEERRARLHDLAERYSWDIAGNFNPRVFNFATRLMPPLCTALLAPSNLVSLVKSPRKLVSLDALADYLLPAVDALRRHKEYLRAHPPRRIERQVPLPP